MEKLSFATGLKEFELNGGQVLSFVPTDPQLMSRLFSAFETLDSTQTRYQQTGNDAADAKAFFAYVEQMDAEMQVLLDGLFGVPIDRAAFDGASLFAVGDGLPLWANFLFAIMDKMDVGVAEAQKAQNPRIQRLMAKYKRK